MAEKSQKLGTDPIGKLLLGQSIPAAIGFLVMSVYSIVDIYFVSQYIGTVSIAAVSIVMPVTFLISSIGMAIGVGGASIISRALGGNNPDKAYKTFGNQIMLTVTLALILAAGGYLYRYPILELFGANSEIMPLAERYFSILLVGIPCLAWAMMSNNVIRAEGKPKVAMLTLIIPAVSNILFDFLLIKVFDMGIDGAGWATTIGYIFSATHATIFFAGERSEMSLSLECLKWDSSIVKEIFSIGSITLIRQGSFSVMAIVLNNVLNTFGGTIGVSIYGVIRSLTLFISFPVIGLMQGFMPIAGFNYGAALYSRVKQVLRLSILWSSAASIILFAVVLLGAEEITRFFTDDPELLAKTPFAMRMTFLGMPLIGLSFIAGGYYQALGKAKPALFLTLARQGLFLIPLVATLPYIWGLDGVWYSFPIGELLAALVSGIMLKRGVDRMEESAV